MNRKGVNSKLYKRGGDAKNSRDAICLSGTPQQLTPECAVMEYLVQPSVSDVMNYNIGLDDSSSHIKRME